MRLRATDVTPARYSIDQVTIRQKKTGRPVDFEITEQARQSIDDHLARARPGHGDYLFKGMGREGRRLSMRQYTRLLSACLAMIGLDPNHFDTHSLRRTKPALIYRKTGHLRAVQLLLGHTKIESTVRYLGIEVDDALAIVEQVEV